MMKDQIQGLGLGVGMVFAVAFPALAQDVFECRYEQKKANLGWVPEGAVIAHKAGATTATLSDPFVLYVHDKPIEVKVDKETDARITLSYELILTEEKGSKTRVKYRVTVYKADLSVTILGAPLGFSNTFDAKGSCEKKR